MTWSIREAWSAIKVIEVLLNPRIERLRTRLKVNIWTFMSLPFLILITMILILELRVLKLVLGLSHWLMCTSYTSWNPTRILFQAYLRESILQLKIWNLCSRELRMLLLMWQCWLDYLELLLLHCSSRIHHILLLLNISKLLENGRLILTHKLRSSNWSFWSIYTDYTWNWRLNRFVIKILIVLLNWHTIE